MDRKAQLCRMLEENPFTHLGDAVYEILYQSVIRLEIPADAALSDTALARELDVSRTPVRNALLRLEADGLLEQTKGRAFRVAPLTKEECRTLMEVRLAVEGQAAALAAERITPQQQAHLQELMAAYAAACAAWKPEEIIESDHAFHQAVVDAAHNPYLADVYRQLSPRVLHYRYFMFRRSAREQLRPLMENSVRRHRAVYNAIDLGFGSLACEMMEKDVSGMVDVVGDW